jgi:cohesin loading factor subunit SCC2
MDHPAVQVVINGHLGLQAYYQASKNASQRLAMPLSIDVALQYSPMTSAPIFGLGSLD